MDSPIITVSPAAPLQRPPAPALLIGGGRSGCGKTTVTLGLLAALKKRGLAVQPFKCGPDFIDPSLHHQVTGKISPNLDIRMCGEPYVQQCYQHHSHPQCHNIIEGVMGLFDGGDSSGAALARCLNIPVLLVLDASSMAESIAAIVRGFESLDPALNIGAVILNQVASARHQTLLTAAIQAHCQTPLIGCLPRNSEIKVGSRHLGLKMGKEAGIDHHFMAQAVQQLETHCDLDQLLKISQPAPSPANQQPTTTSPVELRPLSKTTTPRPPTHASVNKVRIGVAKDEAFCFYYEDNLTLLAAAGAEIVPFSPLNDEQLPPHLDALYLGGGYPELHAETLSNNQPLLTQIREYAAEDRVIYAECGGFMYLTQGIIDHEEQFHPLVGLFPVRTQLGRRLRRLGYRKAQQTRDTPLGPIGTTLYGHEFHYSDLEDPTAPLTTAYTLTDDRHEGYQQGSVLAGYLHLHWGKTPEVATHFVNYCLTKK